MRFNTKKELLKHLGKNENDRKLIDRLIAKGEVYKENGMYVLGRRKDIGESEVDILKEENKNLSEANKELSEANKELREQLRKNATDESGKNTTLSDSDLEKRLKESEDNLEYQMKEYERLERETKAEVGMYQECIRKCYLWAINEKKIKITRPDFRDNVLKLKKSLPGEDNQ